MISVGLVVIDLEQVVVDLEQVIVTVHPSPPALRVCT